MPNPFLSADAEPLTTEEIGQLIIRPLEQESVAFQVATTVVAHEASFRIPVLTNDTEAVWAEEGDDLTVDGPELAEVVTNFHKVGAVVPVSSEIQDDSTPEAAEMIGRSIARRIAKKIDYAWFRALAAPAPAGLGSLAGVQVIALGAVANLDGFTRAAFLSAAEGGTITSFCVNPGDAIVLAALKEETGSNRALMTPDPTQPNRFVVGGVPLVPSSAVPIGEIWGIPRENVIVAIRRNVTLAISEERYFERDLIAVKATARVGFLFPAEESIVKLTIAGGTAIGDNS